MKNIVAITIQILTTIWAGLIATLVFAGMNLTAILVLAFPQKLRERLFFIPIPPLMNFLFSCGTFTRITKIEKRSNKSIIDHKGRSVLYIANHNSMIDPPVLNSKFPITTLMKYEVLYIPMMTLPSIACGAITVKRGDKSSRKNALKKSLHRLDTARPVFYFPEGTRSKGKPIKDYDEIHLPLLKSAYKREISVVPITITGTKELLTNLYLIKPFHKMKMITHNYVYPKDFTNEEDFCKFCWKQIVDGLSEEN